MGFLRLLLAVSVVMFHSNGFFRYSIASGDAAVQVFFMISGFLMGLVLERKYAGKNETRIFYTNRILRVYPSYIVILAITYIVSGVLYTEKIGYFANLYKLKSQLSYEMMIYLAVSAITVIGQEFVLFFVQSPHGLILSGTHLDPNVYLLQPLPQAWSLSFELMFYILAPFVARLRTTQLAWLTGLLLAIKASVAMLGFIHDPIAHRIFPTSLPLFLLGMLAYRWRDRIVPDAHFRRWWGIGFLGLTLVVSPLQFASLRIGWSPEWMDSAYYLLALGGIPALFAISNDLRSPVARHWDAVLGELSYPVYICHLIVTGIVATVLPGQGIVWDSIRCAINVPLTLPLALLLVILVERPVERFRAARTLRHKERLSNADVVDIAYPA